MTRRAATVLLLCAALALSCARGPTAVPGGAPGAGATADQRARTAAAVGSAEHHERVRAATLAVDDARLRAAEQDVANWPSHGRTWSEQRYSPLDQIHEGNVGQLGLAWHYDLGTRRGVESTPIVVDGTLFVTAPWSVVHAVDAVSGQPLWTYDPKVPREQAGRVCCDVVNRGVAVYRGRVYVGTLDGRLVALDAATGEPVWERVTVDRSRPYSITGAPRVVEGRVIIGNGGAEFGVRGYVSAYDAGTGELVWRTYTVPGDPSKPFESEALARAAKTWTGEWWKVGGGGTAWDSMAYDPDLRLLYVGTGNGSPWSRFVRSPGGGDNLYLSSILALRPDTGELVWHFQSTPGDNWDYTATQHMILADLVIDGRVRRVLMQAPKNGFFYVIDRETGAFISGVPYVDVNWASGLDPKTGRPIEAPGTDYRDETVVVLPSTYGAHNWQPMSFSPKTGLVYLPAQQIPALFRLKRGFHYEPGAWNTGTDFSVYLDVPRDALDDVAGGLLAWDPVAQREVWRVEYEHPWNGGTLATGGNLVFQGTADGRFVAYRATDGRKLWEAPAGTGVVAAPVTYLVDGRQYVSVMAGWGGVFALAGGPGARNAGVRSVGRLLTFALGEDGELPATDPLPMVPPPPPLRIEVTPAELRRGAEIYHERCAVCHGVVAIGGGVIPDLRFSDADAHARFSDIVLGGLRISGGMPSFAGRLSAEDVRLVQAYVLHRAAEDAEAPAPALPAAAAEAPQEGR